MGRIDLQLFALKLNTGTSIVDYLKSQGQDSSYNSRKKLANQYGISNYTGTASQNTKLLEMVKNSSAASSTTSTTTKKNTASSNVDKKASNNTNNNGVKNAVNTVADTVVDKKGQGGASDTVQAAEAVIAEQANTTGVLGTAGVVPQTDTATVTPTFIPTVAPTYTPQQYTTPIFNQVQAPTYTGQTTQGVQATTLDQRLPANTLAALNSQFHVSQAYQQAMDYTNSLLQQLSGGKTTYSDQISQLISDYQNRDKFAYNADTDPMFQQALSSAMRSGKTAMQDTMGQAAALTGGYGSSYATNVGQNAYNQYVQEAYDMLPEYYQLALDAYEREGQSMLNQLSMMDNADSKEYDRLYNAYNMNYNSAQNMYGQEYSAWQDKVNNAYNYAGLLNSDYWNKMDYDESIRQYDQNFGYQQYIDSLNQSNWQNEFNYQQYADQIAQNQWASEFDYKKYQDSVTQNNWQNSFDYEQYRDAIGQGNIEWEQGFKESESNRDQSNIEWDQNFTQNEANRDQGNIDWEHGYKESESEREQGNIEWEQNFTKDESERDQSNWEKEYGQNVYEFDATLGEDKRQFNESLGEDKRQFNESLGEDKRQFDESMDFKESEAIRDQKNTDREFAYKEEAAKAAAQAETKLAEPEDGYASLTDTNLNNLKEVFLSTGGGDAGFAAVDQYLTAIGKNNVDNENLVTMLSGLEIPIQYQGWTIEKDTKNWLGGNDNNDTYTYNGETLTYKELKKRIKESGLSDAEVDKLLEKLKAQSKK